MADQKKVKDFFRGRRRKAKLELYTHLKTKAEENRFKLVLSLPLLGESLVSMPKAVSEAFGIMAKDDSEVLRANLNTYYEGMTLEMFNVDKATEKDKAPVLSCTGVMFKNLRLVASGLGEKKTIDLEMEAYIPANPQVHEWVYPQLHGLFFLEAIYSQTEMDFGEPDESKDEDLAPGTQTDPTPINAAKSAGKKGTKSGPKDLLDFHQGKRPN
jgi:hypothetical protein